MWPVTTPETVTTAKALRIAKNCPNGRDNRMNGVNGHLRYDACFLEKEISAMVLKSLVLSLLAACPFAGGRRLSSRPKRFDRGAESLAVDAPRPGRRPGTAGHRPEGPLK